MSIKSIAIVQQSLKLKSVSVFCFGGGWGQAQSGLAQSPSRSSPEHSLCSSLRSAQKYSRDGFLEQVD